MLAPIFDLSVLSNNNKEKITRTTVPDLSFQMFGEHSPEPEVNHLATPHTPRRERLSLPAVRLSPSPQRGQVQGQGVEDLSWSQSPSDP